MDSIFLTIFLLIVANVFVTFAWYGHLKHKTSALWLAILASWGLAFFEYVFQVPANRLGSEVLTVTQLKFCRSALRSRSFPFSLILCSAKI